MVIYGQYSPLDGLRVVKAQVLALAEDGPGAGVRAHSGGPGGSKGAGDQCDDKHDYQWEVHNIRFRRRVANHLPNLWFHRH